MRIEGRRVLVTGATGGIGQAIARALALHGADLVLTGRRADSLRRLATELGARTHEVDLSDREALTRLVDECAQTDILIANAGLPGTGRLDGLTVGQIDHVLDVNLRAPMLLARAFAAHMLGRGAGHMVFISSISGLAATPEASVYCATKFGLRGFALALREELRPGGVGVSIVYPGAISDAGMFAGTGVSLPPGVGTNTPEDVAAAVVRAIQRNRAEMKVAPLTIRLGLPLAAVAPGVSAVMQRHLGGNRVAAELARAQRHKL